MEIASIIGVKLDVKGEVGTVNFNVNAKLEEKERKSQTNIIGFSLSLTTKPNVVKFEINGTATLTGKDAEINKMLEVDPETKLPYVFQKIYQQAFTVMYLLSTVLNAPPPPYDLLYARKEGSAQVQEIAAEPGTAEISEEKSTGSEAEAKT
ncbi:hypothetical protein KEJ45_02195 [Candidatus Bathyarchaeota archaeon]|nr:hypothetical protein [Candidatus Bathyarchaeota archaeon]